MIEAVAALPDLLKLAAVTWTVAYAVQRHHTAHLRRVDYRRRFTRQGQR